jgi:hypothetical protein
MIFHYPPTDAVNLIHNECMCIPMNREKLINHDQYFLVFYIVVSSNVLVQNSYSYILNNSALPRH